MLLPFRFCDSYFVVVMLNSCIPLAKYARSSCSLVGKFYGNGPCYFITYKLIWDSFIYVLVSRVLRIRGCQLN